MHGRRRIRRKLSSVWNLERILKAKYLGQPMPAELTIDDLLMEEIYSSQGVILIDEDLFVFHFFAGGRIGI